MAERSVCSFTHTHTPKHSTLSCNHEANPALKVPQGGMDGVLSFFFFSSVQVNSNHILCVLWGGHVGSDSNGGTAVQTPRCVGFPSTLSFSNLSACGHLTGPCRHKRLFSKRQWATSVCTSLRYHRHKIVSNSCNLITLPPKILFYYQIILYQKRSPMHINARWRTKCSTSKCWL